eukprot:6550912-Karenia_brevis.AAC.1
MLIPPLYRCVSPSLITPQSPWCADIHRNAIVQAGNVFPCSHLEYPAYPPGVFPPREGEHEEVTTV